MYSLYKEQSILSMEVIQNAFFSRIMPFFQLRITLTFSSISYIADDTDLKLGVCVYYSKSNPYF